MTDKTLHQESKGDLNMIFGIMKSEQKFRVYCIFNDVPRMFGNPLSGYTDNPMWCNNSALLQGGDPEGIHFICDKCQYKAFDFSNVTVKQ